jgi:hypothetical protein
MAFFFIDWVFTYYLVVEIILISYLFVSVVVPRGNFILLRHVKHHIHMAVDLHKYYFRYIVHIFG